MNTNQSIEDDTKSVLINLAEYYVNKARTKKLWNDRNYKFDIDGDFEGVNQALAATNRIIAAERKDELDQLIDIEEKTFNRWSQKDIAHFFDVVGKRYRELEHLSKEGE